MNNLNIGTGKYVLAVSGGVDSMVLLDLLVKAKADILVAHFNHGIRSDSDKDEELVKMVCEGYGVPFISQRVNLGLVSEAEARKARYAFLNKAMLENNCKGIITAHHRDDLVETAIINLIRGTSHRGLSSLKSTAQLIRPLLEYSKKEIRDYAEKNKLKWREDSTNKDERYLRNYIRQTIIPELKKNNPDFLKDFNNVITSASDITQQIDNILKPVLDSVYKENTVDRGKFRKLPEDVSKEVIREILSRLDGRQNISTKTIERVDKHIRKAIPGKLCDISGDWQVRVDKQKAYLEPGAGK